MGTTDWASAPMFMGRRRGQTKGYLYEKSGAWLGQWREDEVDPETGEITRVRRTRIIAYARGPEKVSLREARRLFWQEVLSKLDDNALRPGTGLTVQQFVERFFQPAVVEKMKKSGRNHYAYLLKHHILPAVGDRKLRDVTAFDVQRAVDAAGHLSPQTRKHVRTGFSAVFRHAKAMGFYLGENPAAGVRLPEMIRKPPRALTVAEAKALLEALESPALEIVLLAILTSMNVSELLGLTWGRVNLSDHAMVVDGELIPPRALSVVRQYYRGTWGTLKTNHRRRVLPLPDLAIQALLALRSTVCHDCGQTMNCHEQQASVCHVKTVCQTTAGTPCHEGNLLKRGILPAAARLGLAGVTWHAFRRTFATLTEEIGMPLSERMAMMGHSSGNMTLHYTVTDIERRRPWVEKLAGLLA